MAKKKTNNLLLPIGLLLGGIFLFKKKNENVAGIGASRQTGYFSVDYDKKNGQPGRMVVRANDEESALKNARFDCFTGSNFRNPVQIEKESTFAEINKSRSGRNRAN